MGLGYVSHEHEAFGTRNLDLGLSGAEGESCLQTRHLPMFLGVVEVPGVNVIIYSRIPVPGSVTTVQNNRPPLGSKQHSLLGSPG